MNKANTTKPLTTAAESLTTTDPFESPDIQQLFDKLDAQTGIDVLERAKAVIPHRTKNDGDEMNITNIFFLLKISDFSKYVIRDYPFKSFTNDNGILVEGRPAGKALISIAKTILDFYKIPYPKDYLQEQFNKLNQAYGYTC